MVSWKFSSFNSMKIECPSHPSFYRLLILLLLYTPVIGTYIYYVHIPLISVRKWGADNRPPPPHLPISTMSPSPSTIKYLISQCQGVSQSHSHSIGRPPTPHLPQHDDDDGDDFHFFYFHAFSRRRRDGSFIRNFAAGFLLLLPVLVLHIMYVCSTSPSSTSLILLISASVHREHCTLYTTTTIIYQPAKLLWLSRRCGGGFFSVSILLCNVGRAKQSERTDTVWPDRTGLCSLLHTVSSRPHMRSMYGGWENNNAWWCTMYISIGCLNTKDDDDDGRT